MSRIYVASSWRNERQPAIVAALREDGHEVYDFRNPAPDLHGFAWSSIDPHWQHWTTAEFAEALRHPIARQGFSLDLAALMLADCCVLIMPSGRSAHLELGIAIGAGKRTCILQEGDAEPELMYAAAGLVTWSLGNVRRFCRGAP